MSALTQPQREELRFALREQLAAAATVALDAEMLARRLERSRSLNFKPTIDDIDAALAFLAGLAQAVSSHDPLGSTLYYQITSAGILAHERGQ